jgi:hypothetical protein
VTKRIVLVLGIDPPATGDLTIVAPKALACVLARLFAHKRRSLRLGRSSSTDRFRRPTSEQRRDIKYYRGYLCSKPHDPQAPAQWLTRTLTCGCDGFVIFVPDEPQMTPTHERTGGLADV